MTLKLPNLEIYYDFCPKMASTSIKLWLYELAFKEKFNPYTRDNKFFHIHNYLADRSYDDSKKLLRVNSSALELMLGVSDIFFCVLRDPIKRFISAYSNRITYHKELSLKKLKKQGIKELEILPNPEINYFVDRLEVYQEFIPSMWHHTRPMTHSLDPNMRYTHVYEISQLTDLLKDVKEFVNTYYRSVKFNPTIFTGLPREQTGGKKISLDYLSPRSFKKLGEYYASDYEYLAKARLKYPHLPDISYDAITQEYLNIVS